MCPDLLRLGWVAGLAIVLGLLFNQVLLCLSLALLGLLCWQYRAISKVYRFLKNAALADELPDMPGVIHEIVREIDSLRAYHRLREEKLSGFLNRFQAATRALPDAVIVMDTQGRIEWSNQRARDYLGIASPRDKGLRLSHLIRHPDLADVGNADAELVIDSPLQAGLKLEIRVSRYGESSLLLVARDVTEIQRINRMRKDFIANASHELRTPLTVISGYLEAFDGEAANCPPAWQPQIRQMRMQARRMQNLIEDLLKLSSLESSYNDADEQVKVGELLSLIHHEAQTLRADSHHIFYLETDPALYVRGDHDNLYSAFSNIIFNAVQYTPQGGVIRIRGYVQDAAQAVVEVADTGEGIAPQHIKRVTERFYRVDKGRSRERGGTGLGLAIVKHVMVQHGAELVISSELGKGTTITCIFPPRRLVRPAGLPPAAALPTCPLNSVR